MTRERFNQLEPAIQRRVHIEMRIVQRVVRDAIRDGWEIDVWNGGDEPEIEGSRDVPAIIAAMMEADWDRLILNRGKQHGWVLFVYGNAGYDVIADNTTNLEDLLAGATALADNLEERSSQ